MSYRVEAFRSEHLLSLVPQFGQVADMADLRRAGWDPTSAEGKPHAYTVFRDEAVLGCLIVTEVWPGRGLASVLLGRSVKRGDLLWLHRHALAYLGWLLGSGLFRRLECTVVEEFLPGHRWAMMLGFLPEGTMRRYDPSGRTHRLYARTS